MAAPNYRHMPLRYIFVAEVVWGLWLLIEWMQRIHHLPSSLPMFSTPAMFMEDLTAWLVGGLLGGWIVWRWLGVWKRWRWYGAWDEGRPRP